MKTYGIIGIGHFGYHVAIGLAEQGHNVIAVDSSAEKIKSISSFIENAFIIDSTNQAALKEAGLVELDVVIVSMGKNIESSILTVMALRDLGNRTIIAKAYNLVHGEVLSKIGAKKVVYPEKETAKRIVKNISSTILFEVIDISNTFKGMKFEAPPLFIGQTFEDVTKHFEGAKLVAYRTTDGVWHNEFILQNKIERGDMLYVVGFRNQTDRIYEKLLR